MEYTCSSSKQPIFIDIVTTTVGQGGGGDGGAPIRARGLYFILSFIFEFIPVIF